MNFILLEIEGQKYLLHDGESFIADSKIPINLLLSCKAKYKKMTMEELSKLVQVPFKIIEIFCGQKFYGVPIGEI